MSAFPLTPAEAIANASLIDCDKRLPAPWRDVAARLRAWGQQQLQTEHETETEPKPDESAPKPDGFDVPLTKEV